MFNKELIVLEVFGLDKIARFREVDKEFLINLNFVVTRCLVARRIIRSYFVNKFSLSEAERFRGRE